MSFLAPMALGERDLNTIGLVNSTFREWKWIVVLLEIDAYAHPECSWNFDHENDNGNYLLLSDFYRVYHPWNVFVIDHELNAAHAKFSCDAESSKIFS
jgi:hypothetical protein